MPSERARSRCRERLDALADSATDVDSLRREAIALLRPVLGFSRWCSLLVDPDTLLINRGIGENDFSPDFPRLIVQDAGLTDVNNGTVLARSRDPVGALDAATGGDLARCERWRDILAPRGAGDELRVAIADQHGCWGDLMLWRDSDDRPYEPADAQLIRAAGALLARALRRGAVVAAQAAETSPPETGVVLVDGDLRPAGATQAARDWFAAINPAAAPYPGAIPAPVWSAVGRLLGSERGEDPARPPRVRVRAGDGTWAVVEAARLDGSSTIAVTIRAAAPGEVMSLLCRAHGLSPREQELVSLLLEGLDTRDIAQRLFISRYTVQDHLKSVFEKVGVRSRRELVTGAFAQAAAA
jgi:DNA-binding CsgD family transcriptional regulator